MFRGRRFPQYRLPLGAVGTVQLPALEPMDSVERYIEYWSEEPPAYLAPSIDVRGVLEREISATGERVVHHGVEYASVRDLFVCGMLTPRINGSSMFFLQSLRHHLPAWTPFGDPRLLELCLSIPLKFFVRRNIIHRAIERLDPELAGIASANTGVAIERSFPVHYAGGLALGAINKFTGYDAPPRRHQSRGPWPDRPAIIREQSFVRDALERNEHLIRALPFLDWDGVVECYEAHLAGATNHNELYALLTVLEMPVTRRIAERAAA